MNAMKTVPRNNLSWIVTFLLLLSFLNGFAQERQYSITSSGGYALYDNDKRGTVVDFEFSYSYNKFFELGVFVSQNYAFNDALNKEPYKSEVYKSFRVSEINWGIGPRLHVYPLHIGPHSLGCSFGGVYNWHHTNNTYDTFEVVHNKYEQVVAASSGYFKECNAIFGVEYYYKMNNIQIGIGYNYQKFDKYKWLGFVLDNHQYFIKAKIAINKNVINQK